MKKTVLILLIMVVSLSSFTFLKENNTISDDQIKIHGLYKRDKKFVLYKGFDFLNKYEVNVISIGLKFRSTYEIKGEIITITGSDGGKLKLKIENSRTLIGLGVAKGIYKKK